MYLSSPSVVECVGDINDRFGKPEIVVGQLVIVVVGKFKHISGIKCYGLLVGVDEKCFCACCERSIDIPTSPFSIQCSLGICRRAQRVNQVITVSAVMIRQVY